TLLKLGRYREAGAALDRCLAHSKVALTPANARVYLARGLIHAQLGEQARAVDTYSRALLLETAPDRLAEALTQRGWAYLKLESPRLALNDFEEAVKRRPGHAGSRCGRGLARVQLGQVVEAVHDAEAALKLDGSVAQELLAACVFARAAARLALTGTGR